MGDARQQAQEPLRLSPSAWRGSWAVLLAPLQTGCSPAPGRTPPQESGTQGRPGSAISQSPPGLSTCLQQGPAACPQGGFHCSSGSLLCRTRAPTCRGSKVSEELNVAARPSCCPGQSHGPVLGGPGAWLRAEQQAVPPFPASALHSWAPRLPRAGRRDEAAGQLSPCSPCRLPLCHPDTLTQPCPGASAHSSTPRSQR